MGGTITVCATRMTWIVVHRRRSKQGQGKDAHKCYAEDDRPWLHDSLLQRFLGVMIAATPSLPHARDTGLVLGAGRMTAVSDDSLHPASS